MRGIVRGRLLVAASLVAVLLLVLGVAATASAAQTTPGFSPSFRVGGRVQHPKVYRLADLEALPAVTVTVTFLGPAGPETHQFTGARLADVAAAAAPRFDPQRKNDKLRWTARVHATDNYEAVVAWGEFDSSYENKAVLLAYEEGGQPLAQDGMARLVVPGDQHGGRDVSNVDAISFDPPLGAGTLFGVGK